MNYLIKRIFFRIRNNSFKEIIILILKYFTSSNKINLDKIEIKPNTSLEDIFFKFGTDKSFFDSKRTFYKLFKNYENRKKFPNYLSWINRKDPEQFQYELGLNYAPFYEKYLSEHRKKKLKIIELGVAGGHSLAGWYKYFENSEILGVDIKEKKVFMYEGKRMRYFKINCLNPKDIKNFISKYGDFDIVVDDSLHEHPVFETNLVNFFPALKKGGMYFMEDFRLESEILKKIKNYNKKYNKNVMLNDTTMEEVFDKFKKKENFDNSIITLDFQNYLYKEMETIEVHYPEHPSAGICTTF